MKRDLCSDGNRGEDVGEVPESCDGGEARDGDHNTEGDERKGKLAKS